MKRSVFVAVLALAFAAPARAENDREVIKVNGTPIRQSEIVERLWKRFGPSMLDEMVDEVLLRQNARKLDVKAEPAEIDKRLARIRAQFPDGDSFNAQLKRSGATLDSFKKDLAEQIVQEKIIIKKDKISVKDEELKTAFQERKERLGAPERIHLLHMVVDPKEVPAVLAKLKAGADFKAQAKEKSLAPTGKINGGDYGFVARGMLPPEIEEIAFGLKVKEVKTIEGERGIHIIEVVERKPAVPAEFAKIKDELREILLAEKIKAALPAYLQELRSRADIQPQGS